MVYSLVPPVQLQLLLNLDQVRVSHPWIQSQPHLGQLGVEPKLLAQEKGSAAANEVVAQVKQLYRPFSRGQVSNGSSKSLGSRVLDLVVSQVELCYAAETLLDADSQFFCALVADFVALEI